MGANAAIKAKTQITDHTAGLVAKMAEKFYSNPANAAKYAEWHLKTFGFMPDETKGDGGNDGKQRKRKR